MFSKQDIEKYFQAEKQLGWLFIVIGSLSVLISIYLLFFQKTAFGKGAAIPLLVLGLVELAAAVTVSRRSDADRTRNVYAYDMNPGQLQKEELPRMEKVVQRFIPLKRAETACVLAGLLLMFFFRKKSDQAFWYGLGFTLTLQAVLFLLADFSASKRAVRYYAGLKSHVEKLH